MATSSSFSAPIEHGSDLIHDFCCLSCSEDNKNSEAQHYCQDCLQCYCAICINLHNKLHKRHAVLGRKDVDQWTTVTLLAGPLVRCDTHPGEILKVECMDHRLLCCHVCVSIDHKQCSTTKHVPEIAKGFHDTREFKKLPARVSNIKKDLLNARQSLNDNKKAFEKSGNDCLRQIQALRQQFNAIFDQLERRTISELEKGKSFVDVKIQADVYRIDEATERIQKLSDNLNGGGATNEATSYIAFTKCDDMIWKAKVLLQDINNKGNYKMSFKPHKAITKYLSSLEMLGDVLFEGGEKPLPAPTHVFEVEKHVLHNVKMAADKRICNISGICKLATGEFLLVDNYNLKIKLLENNYEVISTCNVAEHPQDVCLIGEREVAVTVNKNSEDRHEIHFYHVRSGTLLKSRSIKLQHECVGLAHNSGTLYITTDTSLHVYNISRGQGRLLYSDQIGEYTVHRCAVSPDGSRIFITDCTNHQLITLNKDGTKLSTFTHPEMLYPRCVSVTLLGHVFVSCQESNTVIQVVVMNDGTQTVTPLAGKEKGITEPTVLYFNGSTNTLVVSMFENDNIVELRLKH